VTRFNSFYTLPV